MKKNMLPVQRMISGGVVLCAAASLFLYAGFKNQQARMDSTGYEPDLTREYLVTQYPDATGQQATFYTVSNEDSLIVIDGGWPGNEDALRKVIADHGNTVDAWILSHPHQDHAGAFNEIYADPDGIVIESIYDNGFDFDFIKSAGEPYDDITVMETYHTLTENAPNVNHLRRGDVLTVCGLTLEVYNAYDDIVLYTVGDEKDYQNNASLLFKLSSENTSILFGSDIKYDMDDYLLENYGDVIGTDYVQVGHHGNWSFSEEFYDRTGASVFFFDAPSAITDSPDFPASELKDSLLDKEKTVLDFSTAPNTVTLK